MKISDVVNQLAANLPQYTDLFTDNLDLVSVVRSGSTITCTVSIANPHGLSAGQGVLISECQTLILVDSITRNGVIATVTFQSDHDFTKGPDNPTPVIVLDQTLDPEFTGTFEIIDVPNRRTVTFMVADSGPVSSSGGWCLNGNSERDSFNGFFEVDTIISPTEFTYEKDGMQGIPVATGPRKMRANPRVTGMVNLQAILDAYTQQPQNELWAFVTLGPVNASKNRNILSDAVDNTQRSQYLRQQLLQNCTIYVVVPSAVAQIAGRQARDLCEDLFRPICQSVLFYKFDSGLYVQNLTPLQFVSHDTEVYNKAYYVHAYEFQMTVPLQFEDSVGFDSDTALRDINFTFTTSFGSGEVSANIDLDEDPVT